MAVTFETSDPRKLLALFKKAIDDRHVVTWSYDSDGDFTHTPDQWRNQAWLRPVIYDGQLTLNFLRNKNVEVTKALYGVYEGRFVESMLTHCDTLFTRSVATAQGTNSDIIA
jgi:hypothetical protein